jgi:hypothetical protein
LELSFEVLVNLVSNLLDLLLGDGPFSDEFVGVAGWLGRHRADLLVHNWLREGRFVDFVVTVEAEANHVYQNIFLKRLPVLNHELGDSHHGLWVRRIYSEHRHAEGLNDVGRVLEAAVILGVGGKSNLVVGYYVDGAVAAELRKLAQGQRFVRGALAWESRVSVALDVHHPALLALGKQIVEFGAGLAHADCVLGLQMARVVHER